VSNVDDYIDERLRIPGAGRGRDFGIQLDWDPSQPMRTGDGRPRTYTIPVTDEVAGSRDSDTAFTGAPTSGSWGPATVSPAYSSGLVMGGRGVLRGYSFRETSGTAPAVLRILGGIDAFGALIATVALSPGESVRDYFGESGLRTNIGLYLQLVSGVVEGSVWYQGTL
jgi:hypothetical protein